MRVVLRVAILFVTGFSLFIAGSRALGHAVPVPADAMLAAPNCQQPCWHGIQPGITTLTQAERLLLEDRVGIEFVRRAALSRTRDSLRELCWSTTSRPTWRGCAARERGSRSATQPDGPLTQVQVYPPSNALTLGDAVLRWGTPKIAAICVRAAARTSVHVTAEIYFGNNIQVRVYGDPRYTETRLHPGMTVSLIHYHYPADEPPWRFDMPVWRGFAALDYRWSC